MSKIDDAALMDVAEMIIRELDAEDHTINLIDGREESMCDMKELVVKILKRELC